MSVPRQREIWLVRLDPISGREQANMRPAVIVSRDEVNRSGWSLCLGVPLSFTAVVTRVRLQRSRGSMTPETVATLVIWLWVANKRRLS